MHMLYGAEREGETLLLQVHAALRHAVAGWHMLRCAMLWQGGTCYTLLSASQCLSVPLRGRTCAGCL
jgi:hypothetical protein